MLNAQHIDALANWVLVFFAYSFLGWCIEAILKYIQFHRFINRGFFSGPILPIYGTGAVLIALAVGNASRFEYAYGTTFAISLVLCGAVEYFVSWYLEKKYHARWWDYSQRPMNLHGRIWIGNLILFGLGGVAVVHLINPALFGLFAGLSPALREGAAASLLIVFSADFVMTHFILRLVKTGIETSEADNTEEINREIRLLLSDRSVFYRRFVEAYPEVIYRTERINARIEEIRAETERLRREAERRHSEVNRMLASGMQQLSSTLEPAGSIKNTIIRKQGDLIALLYDESAATEEAVKLKREIDSERKRLSSRPAIVGRR